MRQLGLFDVEPERRCGTCVVWNGRPVDRAGGCAIMMETRDAQAEPCDRWFSTDQLTAPLYGRRK